MNKIGIIANPASGKDIRRFVSYATVVDNNEKVNIVKRIIIGAQAVGVEKIYYMSDPYGIVDAAVFGLKQDHVLKVTYEKVETLNTNSYLDTEFAVKAMEAMDVSCIVVLGGDGTNRAVAKVLKTTPIIPISTGTNNVYPERLEGTIVGMAAGYIYQFDNKDIFLKRDKIIEISSNYFEKDLALVDAVLTSATFQGASAIWDISLIKRVIACISHPANIGFSAIVGGVKIIRQGDDFGGSVKLGEKGSFIKVAVAAGQVESLSVSEVTMMPIDEDFSFIPEENGMLALDGEREIRLQAGIPIHVRISRKGPYRISVDEILQKVLLLKN